MANVRYSSVTISGNKDGVEVHEPLAYGVSAGGVEVDRPAFEDDAETLHFELFAHVEAAEVRGAALARLHRFHVLQRQQLVLAFVLRFPPAKLLLVRRDLEPAFAHFLVATLLEEVRARLKLLDDFGCVLHLVCH